MTELPTSRLVTHAAMRPASDKEECFYCHEPIGGQHRPDCVLLMKKVKVRMVVEYEVKVPAYWNKHDFEFHRNGSSWCADNAIDELEDYAKNQACLCGITRFEYLGDASGEFVEET